jgi:hypothetical protein
MAASLGSRRVVCIGMLACWSLISAASAQERGTLDFVVNPAENTILHVFKPDSNNGNCSGLDTRSLTVQSLKSAKRTLWANSLKIENGVPQGYVIWISEANGPHHVLVANYTLRGCALVESQRDIKIFVGDSRLKEARAYYERLLKE